MISPIRQRFIIRPGKLLRHRIRHRQVLIGMYQRNKCNALRCSRRPTRQMPPDRMLRPPRRRRKRASRKGRFSSKMNADSRVSVHKECSGNGCHDYSFRKRFCCFAVFRMKAPNRTDAGSGTAQSDNTPESGKATFNSGFRAQNAVLSRLVGHFRKYSRPAEKKGGKKIRKWLKNICNLRKGVI